MINNIVRTRMAPSPTGDLHIGSLRTFLYSYAFAKKNNGKFLLRIEDTDQKRQVAGAADRLQKVMKDFGLSWDGEPVVQSERLDLYQQHVRQLVEFQPGAGNLDGEQTGGRHIGKKKRRLSRCW